MAAKGKKGAEIAPEVVAPPEPKTGNSSFVFADGSKYEGGWLEDVTSLKKLRHGNGTWVCGPGMRSFVRYITFIFRIGYIM